MPYSETNKKDYLKYYKPQMAKYKKSGKKSDMPLSFSRWLGGSSKPKAKKPAKSKYGEADTVRTKSITRQAMQSGDIEKELKRMR